LSEYETAGLPRKIPARRGFYVEYKGKPLISRIDPERQAERIAASLPVKERTLYICPSPLLGYGIAGFIKKMPASSALFCVEADKTLYEWTLQNTSCSLFDTPYTAFAYCDNAAAACRAVREKWGMRQFRRVEPLNLSGGYALFRDLYEEFISTLHRTFAIEWSNAITLTRLGRLYIRNLIRNLPAFETSPSISDIDFGSNPVLVAGAGPSLDNFLDAVNTQNPPIIIAVDTALAALQSRGITPALVIALEAQHWNLDDFVGWGGTDIPLAMDMSALNAHARFAGGMPYFFSTPWTELKIFSRLHAANLLPPVFPPLGSVGLCAVALALRTTRGPIIVCGLDFSFTIDNYHARGTPTSRAAQRRCTRFGGLYHTAAIFREGSLQTVSKSKTPVRTDPAMKHYRSLFEEEFSKIPRIFDIEGSGLSLGTRTLRINEALSILKQRALQNSPKQPKSNIPRGGSAAEFLENERKTLAELRGILTEGGSIERLDTLIDEADYIWAHFPDCAGAGGQRPPCSDTIFLKRLRAELDSFIALIDTTIRYSAADIDKGY
jgi:hypothetical protein